jgi:hypothetical protein
MLLGKRGKQLLVFKNHENNGIISMALLKPGSPVAVGF